MMSERDVVRPQRRGRRKAHASAQDLLITIERIVIRDRAFADAKNLLHLAPPQPAAR
jgi:hypothetical protein